MSAIRAFAAIRSRLLSSPTLVGYIGDRVQPTHVVDVVDPVYPLITIALVSGNQAVWAPHTYDPGEILLQIWSQRQLEEECFPIYEEVHAMLHNQKVRTSSSDACFHEIRETFSNWGRWVPDSSAWVVDTRFLIRVSVPAGAGF